MSKIVISNGVVSVQVTGKSTRALKNAVEQYGGKIGLSMLKELVAGRVKQTSGFALMERPTKARTERKERTFQITDSFATARVRGKYKQFLTLIANGENTMSKLVSAIATATDEKEREKQVKWVRHEICRALNSGFIMEEGKNSKVETPSAEENQPVDIVEIPEVEPVAA